MLDIIHLITTIDRGGAESQLLILAKEQIRKGHEVRVIYLKGKGELKDSFEKIGVRVENVIANESFLVQIMKLRRYLKKKSELNTILHTHLPKSQLLLVLSCVPNSRVFATRHDSERFMAKAPVYLSLLLSKIVTKRISRWIAISESVRVRMLNSGELSNRTSIEVIPYGVEIENKTQIKRDKKSNIIFGTVARLVEQKDLGTLVRGYSIYFKSNPRSELHIVGGGPLFLEIKELISKYSLEKNVKMYGHVENVHQIMSRFDVFVLTSISEGFGLVMLEAMIHSLPIISSDIDTLKEVVGESNALFFKATNQLSLSQKMDEMNSIDIRIKFAEKSVVRLKHFDIQNTENQHEKLYTLD